MLNVSANARLRESAHLVVAAACGLRPESVEFRRVAEGVQGQALWSGVRHTFRGWYQDACAVMACAEIGRKLGHAGDQSFDDARLGERLRMMAHHAQVPERIVEAHVRVTTSRVIARNLAAIFSLADAMAECGGSLDEEQIASQLASEAVTPLPYDAFCFACPRCSDCVTCDPGTIGLRAHRCVREGLLRVAPYGIGGEEPTPAEQYAAAVWEALNRARAGGCTADELSTLERLLSTPTPAL